MNEKFSSERKILNHLSDEVKRSAKYSLIDWRTLGVLQVTGSLLETLQNLAEIDPTKAEEIYEQRRSLIAEVMNRLGIKNE